jgi:hypothetical protein
MASAKTNYMMMLHNSIVHRPEKWYEDGWIIEREILPLIEKQPVLIQFVSPEAQEYILEHHMDKFVKASLNMSIKRTWQLVNVESMIISRDTSNNNPVGFV